MKNLIFIPLVFFVMSFCVFNDALISKEEMMESWAWKIFIFTDEGEYLPTETANNNFDDSTKVNPIFVDDVLEIYKKDVLFLNNRKQSFKNPIVFANYSETKREK